MKTPAHAILNAARDGADIAPEVIEEALIATGDLPGSRVEASDPQLHRDAANEMQRLLAERSRYGPLMQAVEWLLDDGYMDTGHLARVRAAWEAALNEE